MKSYERTLKAKEFPFITTIQDYNYKFAQTIGIEKGDPILLERKGLARCINNSGRNYCDNCVYYAVVGDKVLPLDYHTSANDDCGTVGEQLFDLQLSPDFIIEIKYKEYEDFERMDWVIYKMKNFNLVEYHKNQIDEAARQLKAEIEAACATNPA